MILFFFYFSLSDLKYGDNPYQILGVSRDATDDQIRKAFREKTKKYHPDITKNKETEKMWIKCNDAYELLTDKNRRAQYDRTGSVSDQPLFNEPPPNRREKIIHTELADFETIIKYLKDSPHCLIYFVTYSTQTNIYYEEESLKYSEILKFYRMSFFHNKLVDYIISNIPDSEELYGCYLKKKMNGKIEITPLKRDFRSNYPVSHFIEECKTHVFTVNKVRSLKSFIAKHSDKPILVSVERELSLSFQNYREFLEAEEKCYVVLLNDDFVNAVKEFKLKHFPTVIVFKNGKHKEYNDFKSAISFSIQSTILELKQELAPSFFVLYCGNPSELSPKIIDDFTAIPIFFTLSNSQYSKKLNLNNGDICIISQSKKKYHIFNKSMTIPKAYIDFKQNWKQYKSGTIFDKFEKGTFTMKENKHFSFFDRFL